MEKKPTMKNLAKLRGRIGLPPDPIDYLEERVKRKGPLNELLLKGLVGECTPGQLNTIIKSLGARGIKVITVTKARELRVFGYDYMLDFYLKETEFLKSRGGWVK